MLNIFNVKLNIKHYPSLISSQPIFACSKTTTERLEEGVKYFQIKNKKTRTTN